jgi:hypothetical protein
MNTGGKLLILLERKGLLVLYHWGRAGLGSS